MADPAPAVRGQPAQLRRPRAPAIVVEPLKAEFALTDASIGLLSGAFTIVHAVVGLPLGRLADRFSRTRIMGWGVGAWSVLTAATGAATGFGALLVARLGVGIGEASFAPAANSVIADLYPPNRRARAVGVFQLGLPLGLVVAYFGVGAVAEAFGSWRAPFLLLAVPGLLLAVCFALVVEPARGASEPAVVASGGGGFRRVLSVRTVWWLVLAGVGANMASTAVNAFSVSLFQRWFGLPLGAAAALTGVVVGLTGLLGLIAGGIAGDRAGRRSPRGRVRVGGWALAAAAPLTLLALLLGPAQLGLFVLVFGFGWLLQYVYFPTAFPAISDVVEPRLRSTAVAVVVAALYLLGGSLGPILTGVLSDAFAGPTDSTAAGLHTALLVIVPTGLLIGALGLFAAGATIERDAARLLRRTPT